MKVRRLLTSCFGLGYLPVAPGTWGSLPPAIILVLVFLSGSSGMLIAVVMAVLTLAGSAVCVKFAPAVIAATGKTDPREVVTDEFAGQALTFIPIVVAPDELWAVSYCCLLVGENIWVVAASGFLLFRIFDIAKPWPIRKFEKFPKGWGVLADDLMAGLYAGIALFFCVRVGLISYLSKLLHGWLTVLAFCVRSWIVG
jgi:phosphatidylglycerophosphatase A